MFKNGLVWKCLCAFADNMQQNNNNFLLLSSSTLGLV